MSFQNKQILAHQVSYKIHYGDRPNGLMICHKCNNRKCVNPNHIYAGTSQDNHNDRKILVRLMKNKMLDHQT